jgi:hypothetical protein
MKTSETCKIAVEISLQIIFKISLDIFDLIMNSEKKKLYAYRNTIIKYLAKHFFCGF